MRDSWRISLSVSGRSTKRQAIVFRPAMIAARYRRSPLMMTHFAWSAFHRTRIGWS